MEQRRVGRSGLRVSEFGLGTLTWGADTPVEECHALLETYMQAGGNLIDTAPAYGHGSAQSALGQVLANGFNRKELVIVSKAGIGSDGVDGSRRHMLMQLDESLAALGTDYLDVWLSAAPDPLTPLEEILSTLEFALTSGRVRYVGLSNYPGWLTAQAATLAATRSTFAPATLTVLEAEYSLLNREIEAEVLPATNALGLGIFAWSPLGRGALTGKYRSSTPPDSRAASSHLGAFLKPYLGSDARKIVEAVATAGEGLGHSCLAVALAWVRQSPGISAALIGCRTQDQLKVVLESFDLVLPPQILKALDEVS